jgi:hypothetical protein
MAKPMPPAHRDAIAVANELGYFPAPAQGKEIALKAAEFWGRENPSHRGAIPDAPYLAVVRRAVEAFYTK